MKNCLSILLIIFIFASLSLSLFLFNLRASLLNPKLIKSALAENGAYEKFLTKSLPAILESSLQGGSSQAVPKNLFADIGEKIVTPKNLQNDIETSLDKILPYLSGKTSTLNLSLDLSKYRAGITQYFRPTVEKYLSTLPVCTQASLPTEGLPTCREANLTASQFYDQIGAAEGEANLESNIPNKILINENGINFDPPLPKKVDVQSKSSSNTNLQDFKFSSLKQSLDSANFFILGAFLFGLLLSILLFLLWGKDYKTSLTYFAWALLGFIFFLPTGLIIFVFKNGSSIDILGLGPDWNWVAQAVLSFLQGFLRPLFWESVIIIVIAIGILLFPRFIPKNKAIEAIKPS